MGEEDSKGLDQKSYKPHVTEVMTLKHKKTSCCRIEDVTSK